ncbi:MAG: DUF4147 domain-containing protein [Deltaproteobacteria bacterium]|nr:DUF4147 domain-containing protein [Deltaproteobacteria bacterium]
MSNDSTLSGSSEQAMAGALRAIAEEAISACHGEPLCRAAAAELGDFGGRPVHLVGAGKAAGAMARGVLAGLEATVHSGLLVTKDDHFGRFAEPSFEVHFAGHPVPDRRSREAAQALALRLHGVPETAQVIALWSGGASALLSAPLEGLATADLAQATDAMLGAGLAIEQLNVVRKHLTRASGGRLAAACAAPIEVLLLSDVLGDDPSTIGSGPFAPDPSSFANALEIAVAVDGMGTAVLGLLERGARGELTETPGADDPCFGRVNTGMVGSHDSLVNAALEAAGAHGFEQVRRLAATGDDVRAVAGRLGEVVDELKPGELVVGGGEPTVELPADHGVGGRNQQLALLMAKAIAGDRPACFLAVGSDGGDGPTDAAGAVVDHRSWAALAEAGDPEAAMARADAYPLLDAVGALIRTGPTGTNVLDLHLLAVG